MKNIYLGLPAFNEEHSIDPLFTRIKNFGKASNHRMTVIFYNDGSQDNTRYKVEEWAGDVDVILINGDINKGLGAGLNSILEHFNAISESSDVIVIMDADDTHDPDQINDMLNIISADEGANIVIASRYRKGAKIKGVPLYRILLSIKAAILYKLIHPIPGVRDYTCGFRAYTKPIIAKAFDIYGTPLLREKGFACMVELLLKLSSAGAKCVEIPLNLAYDQKMSESKMDVSSNSFRLLKKLVLWKILGMK